MMRPLLFFAGYEILRIKREDMARLVNLCSEARVPYRIHGFETECAVISLSLLSAARLRVLCSRYNIEIVSAKRQGVPTLFSHVLLRPGLVLGAVLCVLMIMGARSVIWDVRIEGNGTVPEQSIIEALSECGFGVGTPVDGLELDRIENRFLILNDSISWISVNVKGTVARVEVRELIEKEQSPEYLASNLVATKNGVIVGFEGVRGNIAVEIGEAVSEGELLVSGVYGEENTATRFVRSKGEVLARCERDISVSVPFDFDKKVYTGEQKIKKSLIFFKKEVKFFENGRNLYATCDTIDRVEYFDFFGLGKIPIGIRTQRYVEYEIEGARRTEDQARAQATRMLWDEVYMTAPDAELSGVSISQSVSDTHITLTATVSTVENIAKEQEIILNITE